MLPIAISYGDPSGIGSEILLKAWLGREFYKLPGFFIIGSYQIIEQYNKLLNLNVPLYNLTIPELPNISHIFSNYLPILNISNPQFFSPAHSKTQNALGIIEAITTAIDLIFNHKASSIVTCPISKATLYKSGFSFPGHTEFLAHLAYKYTNKLVHPIMMLKAKDLAVVPATIHIPIKQVPFKLTHNLLIETVTTVYKDLQNRFNIKHPKIALAGLNPHASENGTIGNEEQTIIEPAIKTLKQNNIPIKGPFPADSLFHNKARINYDVIICMYHDQALIAIKTLYFDEAVNITLGLPFIRTSPDHGTAFDIAGKNKASCHSLANAILMANLMTQNTSCNPAKLE